MAEPQIVPFVIWSLATLAIGVITGLTYRVYSSRKHSATSTS